MNFFASTPKGLELLLVEELRQLGAVDAAEKLAGVTFSGNLELAYKACLWSRLANRILFRIAEFPAKTPEELYAGVQSIQWDDHVTPTGTLHVNFISSNSAINHTLFGAQKVKDAIVDQLREKYGDRPSVTRDHPDLAIHIYLHRDKASVSIDLSGESLHKRGYRLEHGPAPIKENLAAAILLRAGWKKIAEEGGSLVDPVCGSGTFLIEAAFMAADAAPGLMRDYYGFLNWKKHDDALWQLLLNDAQQRKNFDKLPTILGYDDDSTTIATAIANIERAGLRGKIHVEKQPLQNLNANKLSKGLLVANPPYGERLGEISELKKLYETIGNKLKSDFVAWEAAVFTGNPDLGKNMGVRSRKQYALFNGLIPCQLLLFSVQPEYFIDRSFSAMNERRIRRAQKEMTEADREAVQAFINRLQKRMKHLKRWATRENITCYRIYDADLPEYGVSVDIYQQYLLVKEYPAPRSVRPEKIRDRIQSILAVLPDAMNIPPANIFYLSQEDGNVLPDELSSLPQLIIPE